MLSDFYTNCELPTIVPGWVFLLLHSLLIFDLGQINTFGVKVSAQSAFVEQDTGFEPALPVWKTGVLAADTNPA